MPRNRNRAPQTSVANQGTPVIGPNYKKLGIMVTVYLAAIGGAVFIYTNQMENLKKFMNYAKGKFDSLVKSWEYFGAIEEGKAQSLEEARQFGKNSVSQEQLNEAEKYGKAQVLQESIKEGRESVNATEVRKQKSQGYAEKLAELQEQGRHAVSAEDVEKAIEQGKQEELKMLHKKGRESVTEDEANSLKKQGAEAQSAKYMQEGREIIDAKKEEYLKQGKISEFVALCKKALEATPKAEDHDSDQDQGSEEPKNDVQGATNDDDDEY